MKNLWICLSVLAFAAAVSLGVQSSRTNAAENLLVQNVEALSQGESEGCPNGCKANGSGCWCNWWYEYYREA